MYFERKGGHWAVCIDAPTWVHVAVKQALDGHHDPSLVMRACAVFFEQYEHLDSDEVIALDSFVDVFVSIYDRDVQDHEREVRCRAIRKIASILLGACRDNLD